MEVCSRCGGSYEYDQKICPYCGRKNDSFARTSCPICMKGDKVSKVSIIFDSGYGYIKNSSSAMVDNTYRKLTPPIKPRTTTNNKPSFFIYFVSVISTCFLFLSYEISHGMLLILGGYYEIWRGVAEFSYYWARAFLVLAAVGYVYIIFILIEYISIARKGKKVSKKK